MTRKLEMTTTTINGPRDELNFIFHSAKSQHAHSFRVKYVKCSPTKVVLDLTDLFCRQFDCHFLLVQRKYLRRT